jgi:hypothetical protein
VTVMNQDKVEFYIAVPDSRPDCACRDSFIQEWRLIGVEKSKIMGR